MELRSSTTHPLRIDTLPVPGVGGLIGLTLCPGKRGPSSWGDYCWQRALQDDLAAAAAWRPTARRQRIRGGLLGLLVGDALGVPYEFKPRSAIPAPSLIEMTPPADCRPTYPRVPPGTWSDDGAHALCLAESLLAQRRLEPEDLGRRLLDWWRHGHMAVDGVVFDVGIQTSAALRRLEQGVPALQAGATQRSTNGNGSLMRVLPLALWHRGDDDALIADAMQQSRVTHGHLRSQLCCALYCLVARRLLAGDDNDAAWQNAADTLASYSERDLDLQQELHAHVLDPKLRQAPTGTGYVVDTLWSARACLDARDYESCVRNAIALGNDTDTTAAVAGGLAGVLHGVAGIPKRWLYALRERPRAEAMARALTQWHDLRPSPGRAV